MEQGAVGQQSWGKETMGRAQVSTAVPVVGWESCVGLVRGAGPHGAINQPLTASSGTAGAQLVCVWEGRARRALRAGGPGVEGVLRCSPSALPGV